MASSSSSPLPSSLSTSYPDPSHLARATTSHNQKRFHISARKLPISKAGPINDMETRLSIPVPEMIFGDNLVRISHPASGWSISFTAEAALDTVCKTDEKMLQVSYAKDWAASRQDNKNDANVKRVVRPFDWSYSASYKGTESPPSPPGVEKKLEPAPPGRQIPLELLKRRDPILFFEEVVLYESELDDNGISIYSIKVRVHEQRMLLLARLFMRLDGVLVRVRDTRVYVDFDTDEVIREYSEREDGFENAKRNLRMQGLLPDDITGALRDSNQVAGILPITAHSVESMMLA